MLYHPECNIIDILTVGGAGVTPGRKGNMKFKYTPPGDNRAIKWKYEAEAEVMLKYMNDGDIIYDIGANIADHTIYFAQKKDVKVFAFEPVPEYFELAKKNISHYKVKNVSIFNVGISDRQGKMNIAVANEGSSFLDTQKSQKMEAVDVKTIDQMVTEGIAPPNVIKIDVEGWAEFALKGATGTLSKYKPTILLEPHYEFLSIEKLESKFKVLEDIGYKIVGTIFDEAREFILQCDKNGETFEDYRNIFIKNIHNHKVWGLRDKFDSSVSKDQLSKLKKEYKILVSEKKLTISERLIWSKLYRLFTFKWLKTK